MTEPMQCKICGNSIQNRIIGVKEMMLGTRNEFEYMECNSCHCLQLKDVPTDLTRYYPQDSYYSFSSSKLVTLLESFRLKPSYHLKGIRYKLLNHYLMLDNAILSIAKLKLSKHAAILDVGSGSGSLLMKLKKLGFVNLMGIDPYTKENIIDTVKIRQIDISELKDDDQFDLIMFHHSFEHIQKPLDNLIEARRHLNDGGTILIRIPLVSLAYEKYGSSWFQIDAPRHVFLYSLGGMKALASKGGLNLVSMYFDSYEDQFIWSERYAKDIAAAELHEDHLRIILRKLLPTSARYIKKAKELNQIGKGDQAVFYFSKN